MRKRRRRWYVFGAQAAIAYGRPRMTADVDVTVELEGARPSDLVSELEPHGFELRSPLSEALLAETRLLPLLHAPTGMPLDLVIAAPGIEEEFLARARPIDVGGVEVPMMSVEDLIAVKVLAGRRKDLEDVRGVLIEQRGRVDLARTRDVLAALEDAIGERKLLPRLERLLRAAEREAAQAQAGPKRAAPGPGRRAR
jgi:hypothetical protein